MGNLWLIQTMQAGRMRGMLPEAGSMPRAERSRLVCGQRRGRGAQDLLNGRLRPFYSPPAVWTKTSPFFTGPANVIVQVSLQSPSSNPSDLKNCPCGPSVVYATFSVK